MHRLHLSVYEQPIFQPYRAIYFLLCILVLCITEVHAAPFQSDPDSRYIIQFSPQFDPQQQAQLKQYIAKQNGQVHHQYQYAIQGLSVTLPPKAIEQLKHRYPHFGQIESDKIVTLVNRGKGPNKDQNNDDENSNSRSPEQIPWGVSRVGGPFNGTGLVAWVIDTGIDSRHPDLNVDASRGANFVRGKNTTEDGNGHGTHVAGTIAALNDGYDVVGVAAGATVIPLRVLDNQGSGSLSDVIAAVDYLYQHANPGDCANLSLGAQGESSALDSAIKSTAERGVIFAIAAGNSSSDASFFTPASTNHPNVFTISSIDSSDNFSWFSNFGEPVDYALPGQMILSTQMGGGTIAYSGTSMAAPHFCALALLGDYYVSRYAQLDPDGVPDPIPQK